MRVYGCAIWGVGLQGLGFRNSVGVLRNSFLSLVINFPKKQLRL